MKKDINKPATMNISLMREILSDKECTSSTLYISPDLCVANGNNFFRNFVSLSEKGPFIIGDFRFGMLLKGEIQVTVNLARCRISAPKFVFLAKDSIVQLNSVSEDLTVAGMILSPQLMAEISQSGDVALPSVPMFMDCGGTDRRFFGNVVDAVSLLVRQDDYPRAALMGLLHSAVSYFDAACRRDSSSSAFPGSRDYGVFTRFIGLVNTHSAKERDLTFYADKICLSPRYLSSVIYSQSGHHAKYWIDESVVTRARVMLRCTSKSVSQISDELNFPNDSFFCKFFKRLTGMTPTAYREAGLLLS